MTAKKTTRTIQNAIRNPEVSAMVERELIQRPTFSHRVLQTLAAELDPSIGEMDPRLFHAEYVVPAQGRIAAAKGRDRKRRGRKTTRAGAASRSRRRRATGAEQAAAAMQAVGEIAPVAELQVEGEADAHEADAGAAIEADAPAASEAEFAAELRAERAAPAVSAEEHRRRRVREPVRDSTGAPGRAGARAPRSRERVQAVRAAFFAWARELADADSPAAIVEAFDQVDRYVDTVLEV